MQPFPCMEICGFINAQITDSHFTATTNYNNLNKTK